MNLSFTVWFNEFVKYQSRSKFAASFEHGKSKKAFSLMGFAPDQWPPHRGLCPGRPLGAPSQTPVIGSRSAVAMEYNNYTLCSSKLILKNSLHQWHVCANLNVIDFAELMTVRIYKNLPSILHKRCYRLKERCRTSSRQRRSISYHAVKMRGRCWILNRNSSKYECCATARDGPWTHKSLRRTLASPAMGHWGTCPLDLQQFFFQCILTCTKSDSDYMSTVVTVKT